MIPPISIRNALTAVSRFPEVDAEPPKVAELPNVPITPRLKIRSSAPKTRPLTPASESILLVAREKQ